MFRLLKRTGLIALLAGAAPLATIATCNRSPHGGQAFVTSSNENLLEDVIDLLFDHDDDDDD
jgi:hypothetical protein